MVRMGESCSAHSLGPCVPIPRIGAGMGSRHTGERRAHRKVTSPMASAREERSGRWPPRPVVLAAVALLATPCLVRGRERLAARSTRHRVRRRGRLRDFRMLGTSSACVLACRCRLTRPEDRRPPDGGTCPAPIGHERLHDVVVASRARPRSSRPAGHHPSGRPRRRSRRGHCPRCPRCRCSRSPS